MRNEEAKGGVPSGVLGKNREAIGKLAQSEEAHRLMELLERQGVQEDFE